MTTSSTLEDLLQALILREDLHSLRVFTIMREPHGLRLNLPFDDFMARVHSPESGDGSPVYELFEKDGRASIHAHLDAGDGVIITAVCLNPSALPAGVTVRPREGAA